jgi:WD40 repeat protein
MISNFFVFGIKTKANSRFNLAKSQRINISLKVSRNPIRTLFSDARVNCLALLRDGTLASAGDSGLITIWNLESGFALRTLSGPFNKVNCLKQLTDGSLASGSPYASVENKTTIIIWNSQSGELLRTFESNTDSVLTLEQVNSADGHQLVSGYFDNTVRIWNVSTGQLLSEFRMPSSVYQLLFLKGDNATLDTSI